MKEIRKERFPIFFFSGSKRKSKTQIVKSVTQINAISALQKMTSSATKRKAL